MERDLKVYLDKLAKNLATKDDLAKMATKDDLAKMATKDDLTKAFNKLDRKIDKVEKNLLGYVEHIDQELQEHRHSSELHRIAAV